MRELIAQAEAPDWLHLKPFGYAPGNYINECHVCKSQTWNLDKRAITCRPCAEKAYAQAEQPAEPVARPLAWYRADRGWFMLNEHGREFGPAWTPLYTHPDPRIAELEGLLRDSAKVLRQAKAAIKGREHTGFIDEALERIEAALKEG